MLAIWRLMILSIGPVHWTFDILYKTNKYLYRPTPLYYMSVSHWWPPMFFQASVIHYHTNHVMYVLNWTCVKWKVLICYHNIRGLLLHNIRALVQRLFFGTVAGVRCLHFAEKFLAPYEYYIVLYMVDIFY